MKTRRSKKRTRIEFFFLIFKMKSIISFLRFLIFIILIISFSTAENVKMKKRLSIDENRDDNGESIDESKDESLDIPVENENNNLTCTRRQNSQIHEIRTAKFKQFPFMAAIMSHQNEYLCSGVIVSNGLILTTAQCTQQHVSYVLLNTTKDKKDETTVSLHVIKSERFPTFTAGDASKDVGLIYTEKHNNTIASKIKLSNITSTKSYLDVEALGFGLNADIGQTRELQYVGVESRSPFDIGDLVRAYFDCIDTKITTCFKDTGGPAIFDNELVGIVIKGQDECAKEMTSTYAVNKRMVDVLPIYTFKAWLDDKIKKNEEKDHAALATYPLKPIARQPVHKMTNTGSRCDVPKHLIVPIVCLFVRLF